MNRSIIARSILLSCIFAAPAAAQGPQSQSQGKSKVVSVTLTPTMAYILPGQCVQFAAAAIDAKGKPIPGTTFTWNFGNASWFTPGQGGQVCVPSGFVGGGNSGMSVTAVGSTTSAYGAMVAVAVPPSSYTIPTLNPGGCYPMQVTAKDASGATVSNPPITFIVGDPANSFKVTYTDMLHICAATPLTKESFAMLTYVVSATGEAKSIMLQAAP